MFITSCIQICSNNNIKENIKKILHHIDICIKEKTDFILTPETCSIMTNDKKELLNKTKLMEEDELVLKTKKICQKNKKWILLGSIIVKNKKNDLINRSILINPKGNIEKFYDKIHMFDVNLSNEEKYLESKTYSPGKKIEIIDLPWGKLGMSICYDIRFPNMYRKMSQMGAKFISVPSAFTLTTGKKHWHVLLKARAIENFCYVFAPAQYGNHYIGRKTFGHSLIVSPDGEILCELDTGEGIISCRIDPSLPYKLREKIPSINVD